MYAGHLVFNGRIVRRDAHDAIVSPIDNWHYAFEHLATLDLDGNTIVRETKTIRYKSGKTVQRPVKAVRYTQQGHSDNTALLAGVRSNGKAVIDGVDGAHVHVQLPHNTYLLRQLHEISASGYEASIVVKELDGIVEKRVLHWVGLVQKGHEVAKAIGVNVVHSSYSMMQAVDTTEKQAPSGVSSIQGDLVLTNADLARVERALKTSQDVMDDTELRETYASKSRLLKRRAELEQAQDRAERIQREQAGAKDDIENASEMWAKWDLEKRRQFVRLVTDSITLENIADGWLRLTIVWSPLMGFVWPMESNERQIDTAFVWRASGSFWTDEEVHRLRENYPTVSRSDLLALFPTRSWIAIRRKASDKDIKRLVRDGDCTVPASMSLSDVKLMSEYGLEGVPGVHWNYEYRVCDDADLSRCFCELRVSAF